ncbi:MAG: crosslink repair DNA glycosylase YcaQ family protein [Geminicoccaceae bacterium]
MAPLTRSGTLSARAARRLALAAQGLARPPGSAPDLAALRRTIRRLGLLQLDSVNVLARAHYLPLFARLGPYDRGLIDRLACHDGIPERAHRRRLFEYWAHEASLLPVELQPLLRWRMARAERGEGVWSGVAAFARQQPEIVARALAEVATRGPIGVSELSEAGSRRGGWWGWSHGKLALEWLFWTGRLTTAGRRGFERLYDLPERVLPPAVLALPTPDPADAQRELLRRAAQALAVATETDLRDYFRLPVAETRLRLAELVEEGALVPVTVEGWRQPGFLVPDLPVPRRAEARALLGPFDPLVWERARAERLFGFRYRIEIYTPAARRQHGYYVLPFLMDERLVARVDLKADRQVGQLRVRAAHLEAGAEAGAVAEALAQELARMAGWLALERVVVEPGGDLAAPLATAVALLPHA